MARPAFTPTADRIYDALPQLYRAADEAGDDGGPNRWPLLRYVALLADQVDELAVLYDRIALHDNGAGDWLSDLTNPATADADWLQWLGELAGLGLRPIGSGAAESFNQLVVDYPTFTDLGADNASFAIVRRHASAVPGGAGPDTLRVALLDLTDGRWAGSTGAWERLIQPYLTGAARVVHERIKDGDPWHLHLVTYAPETPSEAVVAAVIADAAKAAGLTVTYERRLFSTFDAVADHYATFTALEADLATFDDLHAWLPPP